MNLFPAFGEVAQCNALFLRCFNCNVTEAGGATEPRSIFEGGMVLDPLVSVIIPAFNAEAYIAECIDSVLRQTYVNLEVIIINDGSTDRTDEIVRRRIVTDARCIYIMRENRGLVATLNQMIEMSSGSFIARMDADDICTVDRIRKQIDFLAKNPTVAVVGSRTELIDEQGTTLGFCRRPLKSKDVSAYFLYGSPLAHPSVMFNMLVLRKSDVVYSKEAYPAEDLELWLRLSQNHSLANVRDVLLRYRITTAGISQSNRKRQLDASSKIRLAYLGKEKSVTRFLKSVDDDRGLVPFRAIRRLVLAFEVMFSSSRFSGVSLLKVWLRTVIRDFRAT